uniref:Uncharacterized protein n=1 Tax=Rhizophora mucronata TaxID=61149 RepID=A0A2P2QTL6_RHIMU
MHKLCSLSLFVLLYKLFALKLVLSDNLQRLLKIFLLHASSL